jgi:hypothetical protein
MRPTRFTRALIGGASALGIGALVALPGVLPASAATHVRTFGPGHALHALYDVGVHSDVSVAQAREAALAATTFTQFKSSVKVSGTTYTYVLAGKNPKTAHTNPSATIHTELVPLIIKFSNGDTWDPTAITNCDSASVLTRTQNSPIFKSQSWTWGGTAIGSAQVTGAFERAEFWKYTQPSGINPGYNVKLALKTLPAVTVNVPAADAATFPAACGNGLLGDVDINWLDGDLQSTVIPSLASQGVGPSTLPIFLLSNVVEYTNGNPNSCCVLGYHNAFNTASGIQTYGLSMFDNSGDFSGSSDISALSHEVGEWMDDPYTNNPTPAWGHIGQQSGCQNNLEVGDPLSGTTFTDTVGGFTYHPQELAFFSWFYHQSPSLGVNGWYSDQGTFTTFAANCT